MVSLKMPVPSVPRTLWTADYWVSLWPQMSEDFGGNK